MTTGGDAHTASSDTQELERLRAENEALRANLRRRAGVRSWLSVTLVVLSTLLVIISTVAVWTNRTALDTDRFMSGVEPTLDDPAFYSAMAEVVSEQTLAALDLEVRVGDRLAQLDEYLTTAVASAADGDTLLDELPGGLERPTLEVLAPPVTNVLEDRVDQIVTRLVTSDEFRATLSGLIRRGHEATVALIRGDEAELPNVYTAEGEVRLNLIPIIADVLRRALGEIRDLVPDVEVPDVVSGAVSTGRQQLVESLQAQLPEDFGQVTIMSEDRLGEVQQTVRRLDQLVWAIVLLTGAVLVAAIVSSTNRRRTIIQLGIGVVVGLLLGALVIRRLQAAVLDQIQEPGNVRAAEALLTQTLASLRTAALIVGAAALIAVLAAHLAGRPAWVGRVRERGSQLLDRTSAGDGPERWVAEHNDLLRVAAIAVAVAVLFLTGIELVPVVVVGLLLALVLWAISTTKRRAEVPRLTSEVQP